ncbi:hypothetical protein [Streptomyces olivaceus]|uniref:hypothetical protein n=1 Tax=Streptomyces olivaceus TaxID=47716 RepID=UPI0036B4BB58
MITALTQQSTRITTLKALERETRERFAAMRRNIQLRRTTIRGLDDPVPDLGPDDRHLIEH